MFHFLRRDVEATASALTSPPRSLPPAARTAGGVSPGPARIHLGSFDGAGLIRRRLASLAFVAAMLVVAAFVAGVLS